MRWNTPPTPGVLAPDRVMLSRAIITYSTPSALLAGTSQLHRTAAYMRCLSCAGAPRPPASSSGLSLSIPSWHATPYDPGEFDDGKFQSSNVDGAFGAKSTSRHSQVSRNPFHAGHQFRGFHGSPICCGLPGCLAPCTDLTGCPANGAFYFQASNGSVALPVAGYDYSGGWTPPLVGLYTHWNDNELRVFVPRSRRKSSVGTN